MPSPIVGSDNQGLQGQQGNIGLIAMRHALVAHVRAGLPFAMRARRQAARQAALEPRHAPRAMPCWRGLGAHGARCVALDARLCAGGARRTGDGGSTP